MPVLNVVSLDLQKVCDVHMTLGNKGKALQVERGKFVLYWRRCEVEEELTCGLSVMRATGMKGEEARLKSLLLVNTSNIKKPSLLKFGKFIH